MLRARNRAARAALGLVLALLAAGPAGAVAKEQYEFDGSLPPEATFTRASAALGTDGTLAGPDEPRFGTGLVAPGARELAVLPDADRVLGSGTVGGVVYTVIRSGGKPLLTADTPGLDANAVLLPPAPADAALYTSSAWGAPSAADVFGDGTVLVHTTGAGGDRTATVRSHVTTWTVPGGHELVRLGAYAAPQGTQAPEVPATLTRATYLPTLRRYVSTVVDYVSTGLVSSVVPGDGRALGYVSTDLGTTWQRVIDTDDPLLGGNLVASAKHLHHVEPFEWRDPADGQWKIGAVALLGDGPGKNGQIVVRADGPDFPDPDLGVYPSLARLKVLGKHQLTDLLPLRPTETPTNPLRFVHGTDGLSSQQSGMAIVSVSGSAETDEITFRPTVTFASGGGRWLHQVYPFVFQLSGLAQGILVAPTWWGGSTGLWQGSSDGRRWTQVELVSHRGYRGAKPAGGGRFWTLSDDVPGSRMKLLEVAPSHRRRPLQLGPAARSVSTAASLQSRSGLTVTDVTGTVPGPSALPATGRVFHLESTTLRAWKAITTPNPTPVSAGGGVLYLVFWVKPARADLSVATFRAHMDVVRADGTTDASDEGVVDLGLNDWTRIALPLFVPSLPTTGFVVSATAVLTLDVDTSPTLPLDYYVAEPHFVVANQPLASDVPVGAAVSGDQLELALPPLGSAWTVGVWGTEAMSFVASLVDGAGDYAQVEPIQIGTALGPLGNAAGLSFTASTAPGSILRTTRKNVYFPAQDLVVFSRSQPDDLLRVFVAHGMGALEVLEMPAGSGFDPTQLRFFSADGARTFEGQLHRVVVWRDTALDLAQVEEERTHFSVQPTGPSCGLGGEVALALAALAALRRARRGRRGARVERRLARPDRRGSSRRRATR